jgi:hypothetical protein
MLKQNKAKEEEYLKNQGLIKKRPPYRGNMTDEQVEKERTRF